MKNIYKLLVVLGLILSIPGVNVFSQVGINSDGSQPDQSSILDLKSNSKGMLIPRMTQSQISAITTPANGLVVFCTTDDKLYLYGASANIWKEILYGSGIIATFPAVTTTVTDVTQNTATSEGDVTSDGSETVTARGVCWSTTASPTIADSHTTDGTGTGVFVSNLTGLLETTLYYVRAYATNSIGTSYGNEVTLNTTYYIGANYGGGIIFYIDGTWQHGLISATSDQGIAEWGCEGTTIGSTSKAIGTGQANTTAIINGCSTAGIAARICDDLALNGHNDWFLPSDAELHQMNSQSGVIGGFVNNFYWSSSEKDSGSAWGLHFQYGYQYTGKASPYYVRAVRAF